MGLDAIAREGARRMLAAALRAEVADYLAATASERDKRGRALVTRNGVAREREVTTVAGAVPVRAPRVNDRRMDEATGQRLRFQSMILPPYARRSPKVTELLPLLYLHGLSTKDFAPALAEFFGTDAGLSASVISRLTASWEAEFAAFAERDLSASRYVYCWADGIHVKVRLGEDKALCVLVIVGVRLDGPRSWWPSPRATGSRRSPGPTCCGRPSAGAWSPPSWPPATVPSGSGQPFGRCSPPPDINAIGCTSQRMC